MTRHRSPAGGGVATLCAVLLFLSTAACFGANVAIPGGSVIVPGNSSTGVSFVYSGTLTQIDTLALAQTDNPCLQGSAYCTNGAGVATVADSLGAVLVGGASSFSGTIGGFPVTNVTYGALFVTISGVGTRQVFPTNAANGLGSSTPPVALSLPATSFSTLGFGAFSVDNPTITFTVGDSDWTNNSGQFVLTDTNFRVLYGVTGVSGAASDLYTVDPTSAEVTFIGSTGYNGISSLDFAPNGTTLYGIANASGHVLVSIDRSTGIGTTIGPTGLTTNIPDIAVRSDGLIFGIDSNGQVYTFNPATGAATNIGNLGLTGGSPGGGAIAFDSSGVLYLCAAQRTGTFIYTLNQTTGAATQVATVNFSTLPQGTDRLAGMKFIPNSGFLYGTAFVSSDPADTTRLVAGTIASGTLLLADLGDPGVVFEAIAFGVPPVYTAIHPDTLPIGTINTPYFQVLTCPICEGTNWGVMAGNPPPGITLVTETDDASPFFRDGILSGTPTQAGVFNFVAQGDNFGASIDYTLYVSLGPLSIVQTSLPIGVAGVPYSTTLTRTGGVPPNFAWNTEIAPPWLSINSSTGVLSGTPPVGGTFPVQVFVEDSAGQAALTSYLLNIQTPTANPLTISTSFIPGGFVGTPYATTVAALGGSTPYTWSLVIPTINGLSIDPATGQISGTPLNGGSISSFLVTVTDSQGAKDTRAFTLRTLTIFTTSLPDGTVGKPYSATLNALGASPSAFWSESGSSLSFQTARMTVSSPSMLPPGLSLSSSGVISGTPAQTGTFPFVVYISDTQGSISKNLSITIAPGLAIVTTTLPNGTVGTAYSAAIAGVGGTGSFTFSVVQGSLPTGLVLAKSGAITGTPTAAGLSTFTVNLTDTSNTSVQKAFTITIVPAPPPPETLTITTTSLPTGIVNAAYSATLTASAAATWSILTGTLPAGLTLNSSTGAITGAPTIAGTNTFTVQATSGASTAQKQFTILVTTAQVSVTGLPQSAGPAQQPLASVVLSGNDPLPVTGALTLTFLSTGGVDNPEVRFSNGTRTANFNVPGGGSTGSFGGSPTIAVITGTVAGTITITTTASDSSGAVIPTPPTMTIVVTPTAPVISSVKIVTGASGFSVVVTGFSTPRNMTSGLFHFVPTTGNTLSSADVTVTLSNAFITWYASPPSVQLGSQFLLTVPFNTQGNATFPIASVTVTLTNSQGTSNSVTGTP